MNGESLDGEQLPSGYLCQRENDSEVVLFEPFGPTSFTAECCGLRFFVMAPRPGRAELFVMPGDDPCPVNRQRAVVYRELVAANGHSALCRAFTLSQECVEHARAVFGILALVRALTVADYFAGRRN